MISLKGARADKNLTAKEVAETLGISMESIYQWESGKRMPNSLTLKRLCELYGRSMDEIKLD